jgi:hypothetical protein
MKKYPRISIQRPSVKTTGTANSWTKWPVQLRVSRRQRDCFVPLVTRIRAKLSGGELFHIHSAN